MKFTRWFGFGPPRAWMREPWFWTNSEAFWSFRVEPGLNTRVVSNGTDALPSLTTGSVPEGAWRTNVVCWVRPV